MLPAGTRIGQWVLESLLGEGGMSRVYKAHHADDTLLVRAVKILNTTSANLRDRMIKEGELQARLDHPNIVAVYDLLRPDDGSHPPTLILEYVNGPDLETLVEDRALSLTEIDQIAAGVFHAVGCAHEQGFVHRDLKPANILFAVVDDDLLVPKLADFGLVKDLDGKSSTQLGIALGTPRYMSPEQIQDSGSVDARSDVFSLGAVLSFMLTRKNPFGHGVDDVVEVFSAIMDVEIDAHLADIESHRPDVPPRMLDAIRGALTLDRDQRLPSVDDLEAVFTGRSPLADRLPAPADPAVPPDLGEVPTTPAPRPSSRGSSSDSVVLQVGVGIGITVLVLLAVWGLANLLP